MQPKFLPPSMQQAHLRSMLGSWMKMINMRGVARRMNSLQRQQQ
jgi:hypothetical protein